jgi:hypothetical protein
MKGMIVGNGITNWTFDGNPAYAEMAYWHSLVDTKFHEMLANYSCNLDQLNDTKLTGVCKTLLD